MQNQLIVISNTQINSGQKSTRTRNSFEIKVSMTTLQASLLIKPPFLSPFVRFSYCPRYVSPFSCFNLSRSCKLCINCCNLHPEKPHLSSNADHVEDPFSSNSNAEQQVFDGRGENPTSCGNEDSVFRIEEKGDEGEEGLMVEKNGEERKLAIVVFLVGIWATMKKGFEKIWLSGWFSWWPWQQEKRLQRLIAQADANPNDAVLQSSLLAELNKHRFEQFNLF